MANKKASPAQDIAPTKQEEPQELKGMEFELGGEKFKVVATFNSHEGEVVSLKATTIKHLERIEKQPQPAKIGARTKAYETQ